MSIRITRGGAGQLYVKFPYNSELVEKIRMVEGRAWEPSIGQWIVPDTRKIIQQLAGVFAGEHIMTEPSLMPFFAFNYEPVEEKILEKAKSELKRFYDIASGFYRLPSLPSNKKIYQAFLDTPEGAAPLVRHGARDSKEAYGEESAGGYYGCSEKIHSAWSVSLAKA